MTTTQTSKPHAVLKFANSENLIVPIGPKTAAALVSAGMDPSFGPVTSVAGLDGRFTHPLVANLVGLLGANPQTAQLLAENGPVLTFTLLAGEPQCGCGVPYSQCTKRQPLPEGATLFSPESATPVGEVVNGEAVVDDVATLLSEQGLDPEPDVESVIVVAQFGKDPKTAAYVSLVRPAAPGQTEDEVTGYAKVDDLTEPTSGVRSFTPAESTLATLVLTPSTTQLEQVFGQPLYAVSVAPSSLVGDPA
jgi:hypothetical protein